MNMKLSLVFVACLALTTVYAQVTRLGTLYAMTSELSGNRIIAYPRLSDGTLGSPVYYPTGGLGSGDNPSPIPAGPHDGNQAEKGLIVNRAYTLLFNTNGGDNTVSVFAIDKSNNGSLTLLTVFDSGGEYPVSLSLSPDESTLYILNSGGLGRLHSVPVNFRKQYDTGRGSSTVTILQNFPAYPIDGLNTLGSVEAAPGGRFVLVSEKGASTIKVFRVSRGGRLLPRQSSPPVIFNNAEAWSWAIKFISDDIFLLTALEAPPGTFPIGPTSLIQTYRFNPLTGSITLIDQKGGFGGNICWLFLGPNNVWYLSGPTHTGIPAFRLNPTTGIITLLTTAETGLADGLANDGILYGGGDIWATADGYLYMNGQDVDNTDRETSPAYHVFKIEANATLTHTYSTTVGRPIQGGPAY